MYARGAVGRLRSRASWVTGFAFANGSGGGVIEGDEEVCNKPMSLSSSGRPVYCAIRSKTRYLTMSEFAGLQFLHKAPYLSVNLLQTAVSARGGGPTVERMYVPATSHGNYFPRLASCFAVASSLYLMNGLSPDRDRDANVPAPVAALPTRLPALPRPQKTSIAVYRDGKDQMGGQRGVLSFITTWGNRVTGAYLPRH